MLTMKAANRAVLRKPFQSLTMIFCILFGLAMIINVGLSGEAMWFWYATLFHRGVKLYGDLHCVFQPLYVLETNAWMRLTGQTAIAYESLAFLHVILQCVGFWLVLRESNWPDWQKAVVFFGAFFVIIRFDAYRFDDFHVIADSFYTYAIVVLLVIARTTEVRWRLWLSATLGVLSGLAVTNRTTDGGLLAIGVGVALFFSVRNKRLSAVSIFVVASLLTWVFVIHLTGDTMHDYLSSSIFKAASAKGGTTTVLHGPWVAFLDSFQRMFHDKKQAVIFSGLIVIGWAIDKFWKKDARYVATIEIVVPIFIGVVHYSSFRKLIQGSSINFLNTVIQPATYVLGAVVVVRMVRNLASKGGSPAWDIRESVIAVPIASLLSAAASQATGTSNSTNTMALMFLLIPVSFSIQKLPSWVNGTFLAFVALSGITGMLYKIHDPYDWGMAESKPMFVGRHWYRHPVYGPMYMDDALLGFIQPVCTQMGIDKEHDGSKMELLSIPFPYANYFCGVSPWKNYVQTWYDTVTPSTVATLEEQMRASPPQWIFYDRQPDTMRFHELEYNHGQPIPHRALDILMMQKIASGQWKLVERTHYLAGEGWYLIQTRP